MTSSELVSYSKAKAEGALRYLGTLPASEMERIVAETVAEAWQDGFNTAKAALDAKLMPKGD